jgi:hypothetical protein
METCTASWKKGGNSMSHAPVTKHGKYDESEPLKCFCYNNRSIDFIKKYHNVWTCHLHTNNTHKIVTTNIAHKQI